MYFDNAATSYPKPQVVKQAVMDFLYEEKGNFQRTDTENSDFIFETRAKLAELLNVESPSSIVFTSNSTEALNIIIQGFLQEGDHVITTATEHNSVIRPLIRLRKERNVKITWVECNGNGLVSPEDIVKNIRDNTKLIIVNHGSNVTGVVYNKLCKHKKE